MSPLSGGTRTIVGVGSPIVLGLPCGAVPPAPARRLSPPLSGPVLHPVAVLYPAHSLAAVGDVCGVIEACFIAAAANPALITPSCISALAAGGRAVVRIAARPYVVVSRPPVFPVSRPQKGPQEIAPPAALISAPRLAPGRRPYIIGRGNLPLLDYYLLCWFVKSNL